MVQSDKFRHNEIMMVHNKMCSAGHEPKDSSIFLLIQRVKVGFSRCKNTYTIHTLWLHNIGGGVGATIVMWHTPNIVQKRKQHAMKECCQKWYLQATQFLALPSQWHLLCLCTFIVCIWLLEKQYLSTICIKKYKYKMSQEATSNDRWIKEANKMRSCAE